MTDDLPPLKPCPFCGKSVGVLTHARELMDNPECYDHSDSWAVICDGSTPNGPGGCGAAGGFSPSEAEAIAAWNARAARDAVRPARLTDERIDDIAGTVDNLPGMDHQSSWDRDRAFARAIEAELAFPAGAVPPRLERMVWDHTQQCMRVDPNGPFVAYSDVASLADAVAPSSPVQAQEKTR